MANIIFTRNLFLLAQHVLFCNTSLLFENKQMKKTKKNKECEHKACHEQIETDL